MLLPVAAAEAAFKGRASPPKPSNLVISPGQDGSVGGLELGMTKAQAIKAWGRPSFCTRKSCTWFTKRQRRSFDFRGDVFDYSNAARGEFASILLSRGVVRQIVLSGYRCPCGTLPRFRIDNRIGLRTGYEDMQEVFTLGTCLDCPGGAATVRIPPTDTYTSVFYLNESRTGITGYGIKFNRLIHKIGLIVVSADTSGGSDPRRTR
jgi:hypothetical protein